MKRSFEDWLKEVDRAVKAEVGIGYEDLADINYRDLYEDGESPKRAAKAALANEGWGEDY